MIDHLTLKVSNYQTSKTFYQKVLAPLGYEIVMEVMGHCGFGIQGKPEFWLAETKEKILPTHIAFRANNRLLVDAFYKAAITAGGKDNGKPGIRAHYHPNYYGAFIFDPDNYNIEAVCHDPQ